MADRIRARWKVEEEAEQLDKIHTWYEFDVGGTNSVDESIYDDSLSMYLNEQERVLNEEWSSDVRANLWFIYSERLKSKLTEGRPTVTMQPKGIRQRRFIGRIMNEVWKQFVKENNMQKLLREAVDDNNHGGMSGWKIIFNAETGKAEIVDLGALRFVAEDGAPSIDKSSRVHCIYQINESDLKRKYGIVRSELKDKSVTKHITSRKSAQAADRLVWASGADHGDIMDESWEDREYTSQGTMQRNDGHGNITVDECWYLDDTEITETIPVLDELGLPVVDEKTAKPKTRKETKLKYPYGRVTVCTSARILEDYAIEDDFSKIGIRWPFVDIVTVKRTRQIPGVVLNRQIDTLQDTFNDVLSTTADIFNLTGCPQTVVTGSPQGVEESENGPGLFYYVQQGTKIENKPPPEIPKYTAGFQGLILSMMDANVGLEAVTRGEAQGVEANSALRTLLSQAEGNLRMWSEGVEEGIYRTALIASFYFAKYYTTKQLVRIVGPDAAEAMTEFEQYTEFAAQVGEAADKTGLKDYGNFVNVVPGEVYKGADGSVIEANFEVDLTSFGLYDVELIPDTSLPFNKQQREQQMFLYFQAGIIDKVTAIEMSSLPEGYKQEAIKRAEKEAADAAKNAALEQVSAQLERGGGLGAKNLGKQQTGIEAQTG